MERRRVLDDRDQGNRSANDSDDSDTHSDGGGSTESDSDGGDPDRASYDAWLLMKHKAAAFDVLAEHLGVAAGVARRRRGVVATLELVLQRLGDDDDDDAGASADLRPSGDAIAADAGGRARHLASAVARQARRQGLGGEILCEVW